MTIVFVTHSIHEAVFLSSRVAVMAAHPGRMLDRGAIDAPYPRDAVVPASRERSPSMRNACQPAWRMRAATHLPDGDAQ